MSKDLLDLRRALVDELKQILDPMHEEVDMEVLEDLQPPSSVILEAAEAAASVFIAFERGYRIGNWKPELRK